ncbi:MAG: septation protein SpoVG family protein [Thermoplasmatales archaeon]
MKITKVKIRPSRGPSKSLLGYADITFDNEFVVKDFRIIKIDDKKRVIMPNRPITKKCGACGGSMRFSCKFCPHCGVEAATFFVDRKYCYIDVAFPIKRELYEEIEKTVLQEYDKCTKPTSEQK